MTSPFRQLKRAVALFATACFLSSAPASDNAAPGPDTVKNVTPQEARQLISDTNVIVLDVRTPGEFALGHIVRSTNINYLDKDFSRALSALDAGKTYLLLCASGGRSARALPKLRKLGFRRVFHLDSGIKGWQEAGLPLETK